MQPLLLKQRYALFIYRELELFCDVKSPVWPLDFADFHDIRAASYISWVVTV